MFLLYSSAHLGPIHKNSEVSHFFFYTYFLCMHLTVKCPRGFIRNDADRL
jgi:hypothetical protein